MDWFTWLSKTSLEPSLIYEYGVSFTNNELEQEDIAYFNHEFLQSMGISIAKHRLEILKLARKERGSSSANKHPITQVIFAIKRTKSSLAKYIGTLIRKDGKESSTLVVVARPSSYSGSTRSMRGAMLKRSKRLYLGSDYFNNKQGKLLLTNYGATPSPTVFSSTRHHSFSSPFIYDVHFKEEKVIDEDDRDHGGGDVNHDDGDDGDDDGYWSSAVQEIKQWDTMFQDLKPT